MGVYTFSSKPTTPGERTPDLLIRFQAVSRTQPCAHYRFMSVHSQTKLQQVRRYITKYFKNIYDGGFIFLCKTKEILKSEESKLTVFDILPKLPAITDSDLPRQCFQYPDVQYKKIWYQYDGKRYFLTCACVIFLFERSKVSHWPPEVLREVLGASTIEGFSFIPTDIVSWSGKLVECRGTPLHIHAALGHKEELATAIHQLPDGTTAKSLTDQRGATPLHYAAANGNLDICEIIVAGIGSEMIYHTDNLNRSPLHCALYKRQAPTITYLIQMNADIGATDDTGNSCLDLLFQQKPKDIEFIVSKLETDCVDNRVQFSLMYLSMEDKKFAHVRQLANSITSVSDFNIGTSLLHLSALLKLTDVTTVLINKGFDQSMRDITEFLPFHIACISGATNQIPILMYQEMEDTDVNKGIQLCIRYGHVSGCEAILGFRPVFAFEETTVCMVIQALNNILRKLRHKTADEETLKKIENAARVLLPLLKTIPEVLNSFVFDCAVYGASETLILLKSLGANFNVYDYSSRSPLHEAAQSNKLRCTRVLLKGGANPNAVDWRGSTALHYACSAGNTNIVKCLMDNRQTKANIRDVNGRTPLLIAAYFCKNDVVCYLLRSCDQSIDLTVVDNHGYGILHYSIHLKENTVDLIVEKMSSKPKPLPNEDGYRPKETISDGIWIAGEITYTDFRAHGPDDEIPISGRQFSMKREDNSTLWAKRENDGLERKRKIVKSPKLVYEQCDGCGILLKPTLKHYCKSTSDGKKKRVRLRAFKMHDRANKGKTILSPFFLAVKSGNVSVMKKIRKLDSESSVYMDRYGRNCLYLAIDLKSLKLVKTVLELIPDIEKEDALHRIVNASMNDRRDNTQLSLLTYMISNGCHAIESKQNSKIFEVAIRKKNTSLIKFFADKVNIIDDQTIVLAVDSGSVDILDPVLKKWRKNKDRMLNVYNLLTKACSSQNLSVDVVNKLLQLYHKTKEHAPNTDMKNGDINDFTDVESKHTVLGKLFDKKYHPALKAKPPVSVDVFQKIGTLLLNETELVLEKTNNSHAACECLSDCIEMKCYTLVETIIQNSKNTVWNCHFSDTPCQFQTEFQKKMYNYQAKKMRPVSYLQNLILLAIKTKVPENVLASILKYVVQYFKSESGKERSIDIDSFSDDEQEDVDQPGDAMTKLIFTISQMTSGENIRVFDVIKLWKNAPGVLTYYNIFSTRFDTRPFIKKKEDYFLDHCYQALRWLAKGTTALHLAAGSHEISVVKMMMKAPAPIDSNVKNEDGVTPLDVAVACGSWHSYKLLVDNKAGVDGKLFLLGECCQKGSNKVRKILRITNPGYGNGNHNKARFRIVQDIWTRLENTHGRSLLQKVDAQILKESARNKLWEIDDFFLENAHQLVIQEMNEDMEYIRLVCMGSPTTLILKHLDSMEKHIKSFTEAAIAKVILHVTARNEDTVCDHLISKTMTAISEESYNTILYCKDKHNRTVLHHGARNGNITVLQHFARKGSNIESSFNKKRSPLDCLDSAKATPLWYAAANRQWKCAQCLLIAGCDPICSRAIPGFDTKRTFTIVAKKVREIKSFYTSKRNKSANTAYSLGKQKGNIFELKRRSNVKKKETFAQQLVVEKTERSAGYKKTWELMQLSIVAARNGGDLVHAAYAQGNQEIVSQILAFDTSFDSNPDRDGITPNMYALINGHISLIGQKEKSNKLETLQALVWRLMSTDTLQKRLVYAITQVLTYTFWRHAISLEENQFPEIWYGQIIKSQGYPESFARGPLADHSGKLNSLQYFSATIKNLKLLLRKFYQKSVVKEFIALFQYLPCGKYTKRYNKYSSVAPQDYDKIKRQTLIENIKEEIASVIPGKVPTEVWTLLLLSGEPWVITTLLEYLEKVEDSILMKPVLLDLTLTDLIPLSVQSEDVQDKHAFGKENIDNLKKIIKMESSLTLRSDLVNVAKSKDMWSFLEVMGQNTLVISGELDSVWQTVLAKAACDGRIDFIKCIVNNLEVSKMNEDQKACFIACNCLASLNGRLEVVKYLYFNRIPLTASMDQSVIKHLIGQRHEASWGILEYAVKGNSPDTVNYLLRCFKDDRNIRNNINCRPLLELATEIGNLAIFKSICKYMDTVVGMMISREELNKAYEFSLKKGREDFCIHLLEQNRTNLVIYTEDKNSSLHYAAIHGMPLLAERIITSRQEVIDQCNTEGYTALDYANLLGKVTVAKLLEAHKANVSSKYMSKDKLECYGWFQNYMSITRDLQEKHTMTLPVHSKRNPTLDIVSILESGNDTLASSAISSSGYLIKTHLENNSAEAMQIFFSAAKKGCTKSLALLCDIIKDKEQLLTKVLSFELKNLTLLAAAVANKQRECVKLLLEFMNDNDWRNKHTKENILHIAVKTGDMELVQLVDDNTKKALRMEGDKQNLTAIIYAASLGLHHMVSFLTSEMQLETETHLKYHESTSTFEQTCLECVLDLCIGWSKLYQSRDEYKNERLTRPVKVRYNRIRGFYTLEDTIMRHRVYNTNKFWPMWPWISSGSRLKLPSSNQVWKPILFSMGYKEDISDLEELVLKLSSPKDYTLHQILKKAMPRKDYTGTVIRLSENDEDINDLLLAAAACGNTQFLQHYLKYNVVVDSDNASLIEVAFAFGNTNTAIFLQGKDDINSDGSYSVFKDLLDTLPQKIKWITSLEKPGDDKWESSVRSDPIENQLSLADLWLVADFPPNIIDKISMEMDLGELVPQTIHGKKYTADIESFKKNELCKHFHAVTLRAYVSSCQIYGRQLQMFKNNENAKLKTVQSVKVVCEPTGHGNLPKIHTDPTGNYLETIALSQTKSGVAIMVDNTMVQRSVENATRTQVIEMTLPAVQPLVERIFHRQVDVRVDWVSLESRRRSGNYDLLLKLLSGDLSGCRSTRLAGLEDVLEHCNDILEDLVDMYNQTTADLALQSLSHIREIVVVYVDVLKRPTTPRKNKSTSMSDILTWEFTYEKGTLKYNRDVFPLFTELKRYNHLAGAVYNPVYRMANLDQETSPKHTDTNPEKLTLDIDLKSFGIKNGTMVNEKLCQGASREVDAIARECESMMFLKMKANRIVLRNSPSVQGAGITYQDSAITVSVCTHLNSQKQFTVERAEVRPKLEDLEDQQILGSLDYDMVGSIRSQCEQLSDSLRRRYGIDVQIMFDEKRITGFAFQRYRRQMTHPLTLMYIMMEKCIKNISVAMEILVSDIYNSQNVEHIIAVPHKKQIPDGFWIKCSPLRKMSEKQDDEFLVHYPSLRFGNNAYYTITDGKTTHTVRWRRVDFESHMKEDKAKSIEFVSINNKLYRILERPLYRKVISQIPSKIHINGEILESIESLGISVLKKKLSPDFSRTIREIQSPVRKILVAKHVEKELHCMYDIYPEKIEVDFASFIAPIKAPVTDRETWDCIERLICIESLHLKASFTDLLSQYKLHNFSGLVCTRMNVLQCAMKVLLRTIESIQFRYIPESDTTKGIKRINPTISRIRNSIDVLFCSPVISNTNYDEQIRNVLMSFISKMIEENLLNVFCSKLQIQTKRASITTKYSKQRSMDEALLWCYKLLNKEQDTLLNENPKILLKEDQEIQLHKFHKVVINGTKATFQMKGISGLEVTFSIDEKLQIDDSEFKRICKPLPTKPDMLLYEFDLKFLKYGENVIRIRITKDASIEPDVIDPSFYKVELKTKENASTEIVQPTECDVILHDNISVVCIRLSITDKIDKECEFTIYYKDNKLGRTTKCILDKTAQSKEAIFTASLQIKKGGWTNIVVYHDSAENKTINGNDLITYRLIHGNKMIEPFRGYENVSFVAIYNPSHIFSQNNKINSPIRIDNYRLRVRDSRREVKIKAFCAQCKQYMKIATPFPEMSPRYELIINRQDDETLEINKDKISV